MSTRSISGVTQTLAWTPTGMAETITQASDTTIFAYTADDERVLRVDPDGTKTVTLGGWYEHTLPATGSATETSYYTFAGQRLALNQDDGSSSEDWYVFADRLDSLGVFHQPDTATTIRRWYEPWGTIRAGTGTPPTSRSFTGQYRATPPVSTTTRHVSTTPNTPPSPPLTPSLPTPSTP